ncbi:MAG TPA: hypothetical protein VNN12_08600 [Dehalococcoidia bacterium]|jgi:DNA-directed RNA polymerase subunit RPC12/RpoP|nr:hypothetical protein [Dehalococcoidia bacterium]
MMIGDVKCYHCGHVSGQIEQEGRLRRFRPRRGFRGELPAPGRRIRCERCGGPVFLDEVRTLTGLERMSRAPDSEPGITRAA